MSEFSRQNRREDLSIIREISKGNEMGRDPTAKKEKTTDPPKLSKDPEKDHDWETVVKMTLISTGLDDRQSKSG